VKTPENTGEYSVDKIDYNGNKTNVKNFDTHKDFENLLEEAQQVAKDEGADLEQEYIPKLVLSKDTEGAGNSYRLDRVEADGSVTNIHKYGYRKEFKSVLEESRKFASLNGMMLVEPEEAKEYRENKPSKLRQEIDAELKDYREQSEKDINEGMKLFMKGATKSLKELTKRSSYDKTPEGIQTINLLMYEDRGSHGYVDDSMDYLGIIVGYTMYNGTGHSIEYTANRYVNGEESNIKQIAENGEEFILSKVALMADAQEEYGWCKQEKLVGMKISKVSSTNDNRYIKTDKFIGEMDKVKLSKDGSYEFKDDEIGRGYFGWLYVKLVAERKPSATNVKPLVIRVRPIKAEMETWGVYVEADNTKMSKQIGTSFTVGGAISIARDNTLGITEVYVENGIKNYFLRDAPRRSRGR